jgi:transposase
VAPSPKRRAPSIVSGRRENVCGLCRQTLPIVDLATGEVEPAYLFVSVLGASKFTYAEATRTQQGPDWIASHQHAFAFFGGTSAAVVCDCLKSGVVVPCRYEPGLQRTYEDLIQHYGAVILPARPGASRDKAKVEAGVLVAQRWILARLRHGTFFSLKALNARIAELLDDLNDRTMRLYRASRRELFDRLDRPALRSLPATPLSTRSGRSLASIYRLPRSNCMGTTIPRPSP